MHLIFHSPLKGPYHTVPSGDRTMARALLKLLQSLGHTALVTNRLRKGDHYVPNEQQARVRDWELTGFRHWVDPRYADERAWFTPKPYELFFTYHLYYKRPDWIGPATARNYHIPYVIAEASYAPKRAGGPWDLGHRQVAECIKAADLILNLNPIDAHCVRPLMRPDAELLEVPPFIVTEPYSAATKTRNRYRSALARRHKLPTKTPWLLTVAMMRPGDKLASYQILGQSLARLLDRPWRLLVVGAGRAEQDVRAALKPIARRVKYLGQLSEQQLPAIYAASDLYVWPAINEAWGMTLLEAQASGLPVVAGKTGGVPNVVDEGRTGLLPAIGDAAAFADAVGRMLDEPDRRKAMGRAAIAYIAERHERSKVGKTVDAALQRAVAKYKARQ